MFIDLTTKERITEEELRSRQKSTSLPAVIKDVHIRDLGYATLTISDKPEVGIHQVVVDDGVKEIDGQWQVVWKVETLGYDQVIANHARLNEIDTLLKEIDLKSVRPLRALVLRTGSKEDADKLTELNAQRDKLASERKVIVEAIRMVTNGK